jgi:hypothetical protein
MRWAALLLLGLLLVSGRALALDCYLNGPGGPVDFTGQVDPFAVPATAKPGDIIWESSDYNITVYCDNNTAARQENENIFAWINPYPSSTDPYYQLGVTFNGQHFDAAGGLYGLDTHQCVDNQFLADDPVLVQENPDKLCSGNAAEVHTSRTFSVRFRLYVKLNSLPPPGYRSALNTYALVQFDGKGGINRLADARNLKYRLSGLNNITVLDCGATLAVHPESQVVDFGTFSAVELAAAPRERAFSVTATKTQDHTCSTGFRLAAEFYTDQPLLAGNTALDLQNGLMLKILEAKTPQVFNRYFLFGDFSTGSLSVEKAFAAQVLPIPGRPVIPGPWEATTVFKINYY